jgi:hypothetical protein
MLYCLRIHKKNHADKKSPQHASDCQLYQSSRIKKEKIFCTPASAPTETSQVSVLNHLVLAIDEPTAKSCSTGNETLLWDKDPFARKGRNH